MIIDDHKALMSQLSEEDRLLCNDDLFLLGFHAVEKTVKEDGTSETRRVPPDEVTFDVQTKTYRVCEWPSLRDESREGVRTLSVNTQESKVMRDRPRFIAMGTPVTTGGSWETYQPDHAKSGPWHDIGLAMLKSGRKIGNRDDKLRGYRDPLLVTSDDAGELVWLGGAL